MMKKRTVVQSLKSLWPMKQHSKSYGVNQPIYEVLETVPNVLLSSSLVEKPTVLFRVKEKVFGCDGNEMWAGEEVAGGGNTGCRVMLSTYHVQSQQQS